MNTEVDIMFRVFIAEVVTHNILLVTFNNLLKPKTAFLGK